MTRLRAASAALALVLVLLAPPAHAAARVTKGPWVQRVSPTTAVLRVEVEPASAVHLEVGIGMPDGPAGHRVLDDNDVKSLHAFAVEGLMPASRYSYSIRAGTASKLASFTTAPSDDTDAPFHFLAYGDNRTDDAAHASVVRAMVPVASDFVIHTGDFVENGGSLPQWQTFFDIEAPLLSSRVLVSAVGNHELVDGSGVNYVKFFGPPTGNRMAKPEHLDHTFRWGNTRFFLLNGISNFKPGSVERVWLDKVLSDADSEPGLTWRVVVSHHGPWSSGPHGGNPRFHEQRIPELFKQHKVDIVFSGHDHIYERGLGMELPFVVTGGGGAPIYRLKARIPESRKSESVHHFVDVEVTPRLLYVTPIRADGSRVERCALSKDTPGWFCGDIPATPVDGGPPSLGDAEKPPAPQAATPAPASRCHCNAVGAHDPNAAITALPWAALAFVAYGWRRRRY